MKFDLTIAISILFYFGIVKCENYDEEGWKQAADFLKEGYNSSALPCEDFTNFACGKWLNKESNRKSINVLFAHYHTLHNGVADAISEVDEADPKTPKFKISVKTFFDRCLNSTGEENQNETIKDLFQSLVHIMGTPPILTADAKAKEEVLKRNVWNFLGHVQRELPHVKIFFSATVSAIGSDCVTATPVLYFVGQTWDHSDPLDPKTVAKYTLLMAQLLKVELNNEEMLKKIDDMVAFENELINFYNVTERASAAAAKAQSSTEETTEITLENTITVAELEQFNPNISWTEYFKGLFSKEQYSNWNQSEPLIVVDELEFFNLLDDVVDKFEIETVFNYIFYRSIRKYYDLFSSEHKKLNNSKSENKCTEMAMKVFKSATARMLFDHNGFNGNEWRHDIQLMMETIFAAFKFLVLGSDWLDGEEKMAIIDKANRISFFPGVPDWFNNDTEIERRTIPVKPESSTVENFLALAKGNFDRNLDYVIGLGDINAESEPDLDVNAYYLSMSITMQLGFAFPNWYHPRYPLSVKYGHVGYVLGHELMHGFDAARVNEIPKSAKTWLKEETMQTFVRKRDCLVKQYSSYCFKNQKLCLSGRRTITENMADLDGLKIAYMAYKFAIQTIGEEPPLPGFLGLTGEQVFFLTAARTHCSTGGEVEYIVNKKDEPHAPDQARIDVPFRNFPVFAKLFQCSVGSLYAPIKTCSVWGSFNSGSKFH